MGHINIERKLDRHLMSFGFMTFIYLIDKYEKSNEFEKCKLLYDTLCRANNKYDFDVPTQKSNVSMSYFEKAMVEMNMTGETILLNTPYYASQVELDLNQE